MHLIQALAGGIVGAANGHVALLQRGTATNATYYRDFEASQVYTATPIALDSNGSVVLYVNELVDVVVYDANGVQVREFVAGDNATAVEVINQSFTGIDYETGQSDIGFPTTLDKILALWASSAGATDWKVRVNGTPVSLQVAVAGLSGLFFNVKSYGALGDGSADDAAAIGLAITAAAVSGGIVFWPAGTYRSTTSQPLPNNVTLMGSGSGATKVAFDNAAVNGFVIAAGALGKVTRIMGLWIGAFSTNLVGALISITTPPCLDVYDCVLGNDATKARLVDSSGTFSAVAFARFTRCVFMTQSLNAEVAVQETSGNRFVFRDCDITLGAAMPGPPSAMLNMSYNFLVDGCRFSGGAATYVALLKYIQYGSSTAVRTPMVANCTFATYAFGTAYALTNGSVTPTFDVVEVNNIFDGGVVPYNYTTDGYAAAASSVCRHGSRQIEGYVVTAASVTVNAKANEYTIVSRTSGAALSLDTTKGSQGDEWTLQVTNTTGGLLTVTPNSSNIILDGLAANFTIANGVARTIKFRWQLFGGLGRWTQCAPSTAT